MKIKNEFVSRRHFLKSTAVCAGTLSADFLAPLSAEGGIRPEDRPNVIGPREGFSPQIGTLVSMMNWMRNPVLRTVKDLTTEQLDYLHDSKSNTIGAMLLHLAATEKYYQMNTFDNMKWGSWDNSIKQKWDAAMSLGDAGRKIKGNNLEYYMGVLKEVRDTTIAEFKKRDDTWLMQVDETWFWGPTNNYCKWFHVCEHESNHNGQMKWIKSRLPGANASGD